MSEGARVEEIVIEQSPERIAEMFGGRKTLKQDVQTKFDAHELIAHGLPSGAVRHLAARLVALKTSELIAAALGMSLRTLQRKTETPQKLLSPEQSTRVWEFAELLSLAEDILGSKESAENWFLKPAIGLNRKRPIDLISTAPGRELVETYLQQISMGVYV